MNRTLFKLLGLAVMAACLMLLPMKQAMADGAEWLCWVVHTDTNYLRCVLDSGPGSWREHIEEGDADDELHYLLHERFVAGAPREELEQAFQLIENKKAFIDFWFIPVYNEPLETSWREQRPQMLMRAFLCPGDKSCQVLFHNP